MSLSLCSAHRIYLHHPHNWDSVTEMWDLLKSMLVTSKQVVRRNQS